MNMIEFLNWEHSRRLNRVRVVILEANVREVGELREVRLFEKFGVISEIVSGVI